MREIRITFISGSSVTLICGSLSGVGAASLFFLLFFVSRCAASDARFERKYILLLYWLCSILKEYGNVKSESYA